MRQFCKRSFSFLMSLCMLFTLIPAGAAESGTDYDAGESVFDFEAASYSVRENEGEISVKILRQGDANAPVNVAVKAADFLAEYGRDYEILLDGKALPAQTGEIVDPSMFTFYPGQSAGETGDAVTEGTEPASQTAQAAAGTQGAVTETEEAVEDTAEAVEEASLSNGAALAGVQFEEVSATQDETAESVADAETPSKVSKKSNSPLRDAQAAYLGVPEDDGNQPLQDAPQKSPKTCIRSLRKRKAPKVLYTLPPASPNAR